MAAKNFPIFHIFCSILFAAITSAAPFGYDCQTTLTFSTLKNNSSTTIIYRDNLNSLLSTLSSNATNEDGFFNSTSGRDRETVYGLFLCRGDVSVDVCKRCVDTAAKDIVRFCPLAKEAVVFYDYCLLCIAITVPLILLVVFITLITVGFARKANGRRKDINEHSNAKSLHYDIGAIQDATNNFSVGNRIGQGGFGDVYKGKLPNGQEIAVKRLSQSSNQGAEEFKSEVLLVAKLQHRNLVRLLGFCLQGLERILIYEFVPNKSLDYYLFDDERRGTLNWAVRLKIIRGIARGLLYLHEDCPLKIVHRDLKPSNILLDAEMNPKISDFGMARIFGAHQTQGNTMRVVGTYGYMSPEYVMYGQYSMKSDVFSFGVLTLEIVTGSKNSSFCESNDANDLLSYAWKHWKENTPLELIDSKVLEDCYSRNELIRCIQIGLLCVQKDAHKRPTMGSVVLMLRSNSVTLPIPQRPAFFARSKTEIQPKESIFDEYYSSTASMYIDEDQSVTKTMTKDI